MFTDTKNIYRENYCSKTQLLRSEGVVSRGQFHPPFWFNIGVGGIELGCSRSARRPLTRTPILVRSFLSACFLYTFITSNILKVLYIILQVSVTLVSFSSTVTCSLRSTRRFATTRLHHHLRTGLTHFLCPCCFSLFYLLQYSAKLLSACF